MLTVPAIAFAASEFATGLRAAQVAPAVFEDLPPTATDAELDAALRGAVSSEQELQIARHFGHWSAMGGFAIGVAAVAILAGIGMPGWRRAAWSAAAGVVLYGAVSLSTPGDASAATPPMALACIVWAIAFAAVTWARARSLAQDDPAVRHPAPA